MFRRRELDPGRLIEHTGAPIIVSTCQSELRTRRIGSVVQPNMGPIYFEESNDGIDGAEPDSPTEETVSLLTPPTPTNLPPTPTMGVPLHAAWRASIDYSASGSQLRANPSSTSPSAGSSPRNSSTPPPNHRQNLNPPQRRLYSSPAPPAPVVEASNSTYLQKKRGSLPSTNSLPYTPGRKAIRWVGVNCNDHNNLLQKSPKGNGHSHFTFAGSPNTPHIIISPDTSDEPPQFPSPDEAMSQTKQNSSTSSNSGSSEPSPVPNDEQPASVVVENSSGLPNSTGSEVNRNDFPFVDEDDEADSNGRTDGPLRSDQNSLKGDLKTKLEIRSSCGDVSCINSTNNSPTEETAQSYFQQQEEQQYGGSSRGPILSQRHDNNFRSMSMVSLDPPDVFGRKTRRQSTISLMRRVASQNNMGQQGLINPSMGRSSSRASLLTESIDWRVEMNESLILCISALYGKLLVVMGMAFPIAEIISADVPRTLYDSFYLYLYFGSIIFLVYAYLFLFRTKSLPTGIFRGKLNRLKKRLPNMKENWTRFRLKWFKDKSDNPESEEKTDRSERVSMNTSIYKAPKYTITESSNHGSMYLKMGAVIFGIGSMIYSGLEFGQYFELAPGPECSDILLAIKPVGRMLFTFLQMYFIFLNSRVAISKHTVIARFGLMHMVATNLCIWLNVLVQETKHEIYNLTDHGSSHFVGDSHHAATNESVITDDDDSHHGTSIHNNHTDDFHDYLLSGNDDDSYNMTNHEHSIVKRGTAFHDHLSGCRQLNLMADVVNESSPFLFPCTIEYSLLCAGVLYVMWKNINVNKSMKTITDADSDISTFIARKVRHHYSVDCARASRGLFMGIFVLVLTIISLILFYVLMSNEQFKELAILEANIVELCIYSITIVFVVYGMKQMRELEFIPEGDIELDNILLLIAQAGVYIYTSFTIIGGYFNVQESRAFSLLTATVTLVQATLQTLFILDGSRRCCYTAEQLDRKPGRETVTFLIVCNLAMWAISTFETSRADVHPTQLHFYGVWAWTIISHVSMPLAIFYRFHVTVCLGEIWKRSYKLKNEFIMTI